METAEASVATQEPAQPVIATEAQAPIGVVARLRRFFKSLDPLKQIDDADHQIDLARDPSA